MKVSKLFRLIVVIPISIFVLSIISLMVYSNYTLQSIFSYHIEDHNKVIFQKVQKDTKNRINQIFQYSQLLQKRYGGDIEKEKADLLEYIHMLQDINKYIFVYEQVNLDGGDRFAKMLINPNVKHLEGKYLHDSYKDAKGKEFRKEFLKEIKKDGESLVTYHYQKPNTTLILEKTSYFKYFKRYDWIAATGIYVDHIEKEYFENSKILLNKIESELFKKKFFLIVFFLFPLIVILFLTMNRVKRLIFSKEKQLTKSNRVFSLLSALQSNLIKLNSIAEFGKYIKGLMRFLKIDRLYIFKNTKDNLCTSIVFEYCANGITPQLHNPDLQNLNYKESGFQRWLDSFLKHQSISGDIESFPDVEKETLELQDIQSILVIPIYYDNKLWGFIGFDECKQKRKWSGMEKFVLKTLANLYSVILSKEMYTKDLEKKVQQKVIEAKRKDEIIMHQTKLVAMGDMIGNIAHQWRQPINNLSLLNITLYQKYKSNQIDNQFMEKYQGKTDKLIQSMSKTIDEFRNFFSPNRSKENFLVQDAIEDSINMASASLKNNDIEIKTFYNVSSKIFSYKNELSQVMLNLINNAKDALVENNIQQRFIHINGYEDEGFIWIEVMDNGGGITQEVLPKIYEPYFTTKFKKQGTGIGLYMTKVIITEHMHSTIEIQNFEDGLKVLIQIPIVDQTQE